MTSEDGAEGIGLKEFLEMWVEDGTKLVEEERRTINGFTWLLYSVYYPESTEEYGRHMAMLLKVATETQVILAHDVENLAGSFIGGGYRTIQDWFDCHAGKY